MRSILATVFRLAGIWLLYESVISTISLAIEIVEQQNLAYLEHIIGGETLPALIGIVLIFKAHSFAARLAAVSDTVGEADLTCRDLLYVCVVTTGAILVTQRLPLLYNDFRVMRISPHDSRMVHDIIRYILGLTPLYLIFGARHIVNIIDGRLAEAANLEDISV